MYKAIIAIVIAATFVLMPMKGTEAGAAVTCNSTPVIATVANPYPAVSTYPAIVTGVCVRINGQTYTVTSSGQTVLPGGCFVVNKGTYYASVGQSFPGYNNGCLPIQQMSVRTVRMNASGR